MADTQRILKGFYVTLAITQLLNDANAVRVPKSSQEFGKLPGHENSVRHGSSPSCSKIQKLECNVGDGNAVAKTGRLTHLSNSAFSAPKRSESKHDHPHEDAVELYVKHVGADNVLHTGEKRYSFICDIFNDGQFTIIDEKGELADTYGLKEGNGGGIGRKSVKETAPLVFTRVDHRPMG